MHTRRAFGAMALASGFLAGQARGSPPPLPPQAQTNVAELLAGRNAPGGFVAVSRGAELVHFHPWGEASRPFHVPVTERTLFHLGSCGKQVTAMAVLQLEESGKVDAARPVGDYVKDLPGVWASIPVWQLLSHTSGLQDYLEVVSEWDRPMPKTLIVERLGGRPKLFEPGETYSYSNTGYLILGWLIAEVSGLTYGEYVRTRIFQPAGTPSARPDAAGQVIENRAEPYTFYADAAGGGPRIAHATRMASMVSALGDGGVLMAAQDDGPWRAALAAGKIVSPSALQRALQPARMNTGRFAPYNYGFFLDRVAGQRVHGHGGGVPGFVTQWKALPDKSLSVLACSNFDGQNGVSLGTMVDVVMEAVEPGSTAWALTPKSQDARARALKSVLTRGENPLDRTVVASELLARGNGPRGLPRAPASITVEPVESYEANGGEMVRYRTQNGTNRGHLLAGWTRDEKLFWL